MRIELDLNTAVLNAFIARYPQAMNESIELFKGRVGYKIEAEAKRSAPAITGNLRRQIAFSGVTRGSILYAHAEYSRFVHGAPFHKNIIRRRETPFFTDTLKTQESFIQDEANNILKRVLK